MTLDQSESFPIHIWLLFQPYHRNTFSHEYLSHRSYKGVFKDYVIFFFAPLSLSPGIQCDLLMTPLQPKDHIIFVCHLTKNEVYTIDIHLFLMSSRMSFKTLKASKYEGARSKFTNFRRIYGFSGPFWGWWAKKR